MNQASAGSPLVAASESQPGHALHPTPRNTPISSPLATNWATSKPHGLPTALVNWLTRRRIAISLLGFTGLVLLNVVVMRTIPFNPVDVTQPWVCTALLMIATGLGIRSWSAGTLNKSRELTTVGPYALVRNPLYCGSFLLMLGFCIICRDIPTLLFIAGPLSLLYWIQVRVEEQRLESLFSADWPNYSSSVPRFFPRLNRLRFCRQSAFQGWSVGEWLRNREYQALLACGLGLLAIYAWRVALS